MRKNWPLNLLRFIRAILLMLRKVTSLVKVGFFSLEESPPVLSLCFLCTHKLMFLFLQICPLCCSHRAGGGLWPHPPREEDHRAPLCFLFSFFLFNIPAVPSAQQRSAATESSTGPSPAGMNWACARVCECERDIDWMSLDPFYSKTAENKSWLVMCEVCVCVRENQWLLYKVNLQRGLFLCLHLLFISNTFFFPFWVTVCIWMTNPSS